MNDTPVRDDPRVTTRADHESPSASPLVRLPVRTRPVRKPSPQPKRAGSSLVILLFGGCSVVTLLDLFVLLENLR
jgi:hypothetical protein